MKRWIALVGISLLSFTAFLDVTIVNTALPFIQADFHANVLELQWVTNIFIILLAMTMVAAGRFADLHGRKLIFYSGVAIFGLGALGAGWSPSIEFLIFFRAVQGLGASILFVSSVSLISEAFAKHEHGRATGIYTGITGLGLAIGPTLGGFLVGWLGWRWVFWVNLPLIIVGYICCALCLKLTPHPKSHVKIDGKGLALLIAGLGSLIYGIIEAANATAFFWAFLLAGVILLSFFFFSEKKSKMPLIDFSIFKNPLVLLCILNVSAGYGTVVYMFFDPLYLRTLRALSAYEIGFMITAIPIGQVAISFLFNRLLKWVSIEKYQLISIGFAFLSTLFHRLIEPSTPFPLLLIPFFLLGINWGMINTGVITGVNQAVQLSKVGEAIGSVFTFWNITGSIFLAISSAIFHWVQKQSFIEAFHAMTNVNLCLSLLFCLVGFYTLQRAHSKS